MNRTHLYLILAFAIVAVYLILPRHESPETAIETEVTQTKRQETNAVATPQVSLPVVPVAANTEAAAPNTEGKDESLQAPKGTVPYELYGNFVVAYGDVLLGAPTVDDFPKNGFIESPKIKLWSVAEIPYSIDSGLTNPERVLRTIEYFNSQSPVRFVPYDGQQPDSIVFMPGDDQCLSYVGRVGGHQPIYLAAKCGEREIAHELLHVLGFMHEQSRPDRDRYVRIHWQNIEEEKKSQFVMAPEALFETFKNRPFDYRSAMLYPPDAFAKERGLITLETLGQPIDPVQTGISEEDMNRLYLLYNK